MYIYIYILLFCKAWKSFTKTTTARFGLGMAPDARAKMARSWASTTGVQTDRKTDSQTDRRQTDTQIDREAGPRQGGRQAVRQTDRLYKTR